MNIGQAMIYAFNSFLPEPPSLFSGALQQAFIWPHLFMNRQHFIQ